MRRPLSVPVTSISERARNYRDHSSKVSELLSSDSKRAVGKALDIANRK